MTNEEVREFLALYEEVLSYKEIAEKTGRSVRELMDIYDDMFSTGELFIIKDKVGGLSDRGGIVRIHPLSFEYKIYTDRADIIKDGFFVQNVVRACMIPDSVVSGFFWRYGNELDISNLKEAILNSVPDLYKPIVATNKSEGYDYAFESIMYAVSWGYNKVEIRKAIERGTKYRGFYWRFA